MQKGIQSAQRKRNLKESEEHKLLKQVGRRFFKNYFGVRDEDIYEDFPLGDYVFDVLVYPKRSRPEASKLSILSMECGSLSCKGSKDCINYLRKIADMLDFVDLVIWVPYSIYYTPFADILSSRSFSKLDENGKVIFSTESLGLHKGTINLPINKDEQVLLNISSSSKDAIVGLIFVKGDTYEKLKNKGITFLP